MTAEPEVLGPAEQRGTDGHGSDEGGLKMATRR